MENFNDKINKFRTECYEYIRKEVKRQADKNKEFYLVDSNAVEEMDTDVLLECPVQYYEGKHDSIYYFYIYKIQITNEGGLWFHGIELGEGENYVFGLDEVESDCLSFIASYIQYLNTEANG